MDSQTFNFKEITEDSITYYIIPKGTFLYHGSNKIYSPEQLDKERHTFFALTNEYANKYAKKTGNVLRFKVSTELKLVAMDKPNKKLYDKASIEAINIKKIMDENYGFNNEHKRKSIPDKDNELSEYLCKKGYDGYAANHMKGTTFDEDLDP